MLVVAGWPQLHDLWSSTDGNTFKQESNEVWGCDGIISSVSQIGCGKVSDCSSPYHSTINHQYIPTPFDDSRPLPTTLISHLYRLPS